MAQINPAENSPKDGKGCFICILPLGYHQNATEAHPGLCGSCFLQEKPMILLSLVFFCRRKIGPTLCVHAHTGVITWRLAGFPGAFEHPEVKGEGQRILSRGNKSNKWVIILYRIRCKSAHYGSELGQHARAQDRAHIELWEFIHLKIWPLVHDTVTASPTGQLKWYIFNVMICSGVGDPKRNERPRTSSELGRHSDLISDISNTWSDRHVMKEKI